MIEAERDSRARQELDQAGHECMWSTVFFLFNQMAWHLWIQRLMCSGQPTLHHPPSRLRHHAAMRTNHCGHTSGLEERCRRTMPEASWSEEQRLTVPCCLRGREVWPQRLVETAGPYDPAPNIQIPAEMSVTESGSKPVSENDRWTC